MRYIRCCRRRKRRSSSDVGQGDGRTERGESVYILQSAWGARAVGKNLKCACFVAVYAVVLFDTLLYLTGGESWRGRGGGNIVTTAPISVSESYTESHFSSPRWGVFFICNGRILLKFFF